MNIKLESPKDRDLFFHEGVNQSSIGKLVEAIIEINKHDKYLSKIYALHNIEYTPKPIKMYIDSYGGNVYQCFGLMSVMERSKTPIHTIVTGCAMSCGFMMLISGHKRYAHRLSTPLYHQVSHGAWGTVGDTEIAVNEAKRLQKIIEEETLDKTKISKAKLKEIYTTKTDWYMSAQEALTLGVVDAIL